MDSQTDQLSKLLQSSSSGSLINFDALLAPILPFIIIVTILTCIITLLYCVSIINKWRANKAILEMRDMLRDFHSEHFSQSTQPVETSVQSARTEDQSS